MATPNMAAGQKHKQGTSGSPDDWTTRERLILASSVVRSGDQNWVSVSRAIRPVAEHGPCARSRPPDFFSQKNCAVHYSKMLEKVATPKRKRTEGGGAETPGEQIVRTLTFERMEELKKSIKGDHLRFRALRARIEEVRNGKYDDKLQDMCTEIEVRRNRKKEMLAKANSSQAEPDTNLPSTPTNPTPLSGGSRPGMQSLPSPQKGKQQRIPKPTEKFQKYQQQQRQRHGHASHQAQFPGQPSEGAAHSAMQPDNLVASKMPGTEQAAAGLHTPVKESNRTEGKSAAINNQAATQATTPQSPWKQEPVPQSPATTPNQQVPAGNSTASNEPTLLSLLSQPPKDLKQTVKELGDDAASEKDVVPQVASSEADPQPPDTPSKDGDSQNTNGKPFLGAGSLVESKKLDSIRDRRASTGHAPVVSAASPSVIAPTLSKLLTSATSSPTVNASSPHITTSKSASATKVSIGSDSVTPVESNSLLGRRGGGIAVGGQGDDGGVQMAAVSFSPKSAVKAELSSPMAITPPPNTPPADKKEMIPEVLVETEVKATTDKENSTAEAASVKIEEPVNNSKGDELNIEEKEAADVTPKMTTRTRAAKPGRPGRPPKSARRPGRGRTKSSNSTDNEVEVVEAPAEVEVMDVECEKASEKGEEEEVEPLPAVEPEKKEEPAVNEDEEEEAEEEDEKEEEESGDDGERSQTSEPGSSLKELIDKQDVTGSESVPVSPCSQVSLGSGDDPEAVQAQKTWKKSIMLVWRAAANHKYANVFLHPVTDDEAPGYHSVVFRPMDLTTIKKSIENGTIRTTSEFQRDMMLMFQNALMYNNSDHDVYRMAQEMRDDVMEQIQSYIATQLMVRSSDRESKMLRGHRTDVFHFFL